MIRKLLLVGAIFLSANAACAQSRTVSASSPAEMIRALDGEWLTAYDRSDAEAIRKIFTEDARMIHSDGRVTTKSDELKNVKTAAPPELKASWKTEEIEVRFYGKTAVSSGLAIQEGKYDGQSFARKYRYTNVYVQRKKQWRLVSAQYSRMEK